PARAGDGPGFLRLARRVVGGVEEVDLARGRLEIDHAEDARVADVAAGALDDLGQARGHRRVRRRATRLEDFQTGGDRLGPGGADNGAVLPFGERGGSLRLLPGGPAEHSPSAESDDQDAAWDGSQRHTPSPGDSSLTLASAPVVGL